MFQSYDTDSVHFYNKLILNRHSLEGAPFTLHPPEKGKVTSEERSEMLSFLIVITRLCFHN